MAAGQGFKTFTTGEVLTAGDVNGYLMQGINVFANATARDAAITAPAEGQFAFTKDNNSLWYYDGAAWVASGATGDIEGVTAGVGISGGGTSGTVTITNSMATAIDAKGDLVVGTGADTFSRIAVGANDTVLTADSTAATGVKWAAASSGGANFTLVNAGGTALTGAQTVTVSGITGANQLFVYIVGASSANGSSFITLRLNGDTGANYNQYGVNIIAPALYSASYLDFAQGNGNASYRLGRLAERQESAVQAYALISGCNASGIKVIQSAGTGNSDSNTNQAYIAGGFYNSASTISSVSIFSSSGNLDDGTVYVYKA